MVDGGGKRSGSHGDRESIVNRRSILLGSTSLATAAALGSGVQIRTAQAQQPSASAGRPPNILVIWGDDIGTWNISHNNRGMMGYKTPNIDRIASEGVAFTDYYAQQSCTAGRAAFISGMRAGAHGHDQGRHARRQGRLAEDRRRPWPRVLKSQGLRHRPVRQEPPGRPRRAPADHARLRRVLRQPLSPQRRGRAGEPRLSERHEAANGKTSSKKFGPRGVIKSKADGKGGQTIENTGPLTKKRMETIDDETSRPRKDFITRQAKAGKPFFCWWNAHAHALPHAREGRAQRHLRARTSTATAWSSTTCTSASCSS